MDRVPENNHDPLARAVDQVRHDPLPEDSLAQTLARVRSIQPQKEPPRRRRHWLLGSFVALEGLAAAILLMFMVFGDIIRGPEEPRDHYLVAVTDMEPGMKITNMETQLREQGFIPGSAPPKAMTKGDVLAKPDKLLGRVLVRPVARGEAITERHLKDDSIAEKLKPGERAISIPVKYDSVITGFTLPGNNVDLTATYNNGNAVLAKTFLQNARVLAVNVETTRPETGPAIVSPTTVTIAVPAQDAEKIAWAVKQSQFITMSTRNPNDTAVVKITKTESLDSSKGKDSMTGEEDGDEKRPGPPPAQGALDTFEQKFFNGPNLNVVRHTKKDGKWVLENGTGPFGSVPKPDQGGPPPSDPNPKGTTGDTKKEDPKPPQVWKQNGGRPTFARVYVGDGNSLELVSLQVTVTVEGPRARTLVDHIFRNPHDRRLEGTFEYPLPSGASPSYFAMFLGQTRDTVPPRFTRQGNTPPLPADKLAQLPPEQIVKHVNNTDWGQFQEGHVVGKEKALDAYEQIVRGRIDPALLEYAGGNTFSGRVFPIQPKGYNRVLIAYEELLPVSGEQMIYRYPLPDCKMQEIQFSLYANSNECRKVAFKPVDAKMEDGGSQVAYSRTWIEKGPGGDVLFACTPTNPLVQSISGRTGSEAGSVYVYARVRPELKSQTGKVFSDRAVFLLDTSLSEHPDRFNVNMKLLRKILESDKDIKQFNVLTFNVGAAWLDDGWLPNTQAGRDKAFARLDGLVLEGATDIGAALTKLAGPKTEKSTPVNVFLLSDGQITWGEPDVKALVSRFEQNCTFPTHFHCYRTGLGADNLELFEALTRRGGGIFNCFTEADLPAVAVAHRQQCLTVDSVRFTGGPAASDILIAGRRAAVYPGGELIVAAKLASPGRTTLLVEGSYQGQKVVEEYPLEVTAAGELAARGWAEIAVASLLGLNDSTLDNLVTAYCQQFGIASRVASFLVLENENDYKRLNLEEERGKTVSGDLSKFLDNLWKNMGRGFSVRESFTRFLARVGPRVNLFNGPNGQDIAQMLILLSDADFELPEAPIAGALLHKADVPPKYLTDRNADRRNVEPYLAEARRRLAANDADGAVRVLSSIIEEHPARGDALRLVGYRLLDLKQPAQAVRLFERVQRARPFEPHSYLDLARSLEQSGKYGMAAVQYEIALAGTWDGRFHASLKDVAREDYGRMMWQAIREQKVSRALADHFGQRIDKLGVRQMQSDLRVSMTWNTDATDVDLWVIEPDGTKCFYGNRSTKNLGELTQDMTQGYGPERYQMKNAMTGEYRIVVHYYGANANLLGGETHVNVTVTRFAGTAREVVERHTVILRKHGEQVEVCKVKF